MSYIVQQSVLNSKPVIGISINYRMAAFGFLYSKEVEEAGAQNIGLRDQRLAMQWVNKYISAFGGDPKKVTIWGESAGAYSVGDHIAAYNGNNKGLFRAAILESGGAVGAPLNGTDWYQHMYDNLTESVGCAGAKDTLQCLRDVPFEKIAPYGYQGLEWFHVIDGSFIPRYGQQSLRKGKFASIPIILGTNTDEGFGVNGVNSDSDAINQLVHSKRWNVNETVAKRLLELYPNDPALGQPYGWGNRTWPQFGLQYKRYQSIATDLTMYAPRRQLAQSMSERVDSVYSYRWDAPKFNNTPENIGVNHFSEVSTMVSRNCEKACRTDLCNRYPSYSAIPSRKSPHWAIARRTSPCQSWSCACGHRLRMILTRMAMEASPYLSYFVGNGILTRRTVSQIPEWPSYAGNATNFVFRKDRSYIEEDDDRAEGVAYINNLVR
jgi:carboxylesterase type B